MAERDENVPFRSRSGHVWTRSALPRRINEIIQGKRGITADTAMRLGQFFGMEAQFWMNLQSHYDLEVALTRRAGFGYHVSTWLYKWVGR